MCKIYDDLHSTVGGEHRFVVEVDTQMYTYSNDIIGHETWQKYIFNYITST